LINNKTDAKSKDVFLSDSRALASFKILKDTSTLCHGQNEQEVLFRYVVAMTLHGIEESWLGIFFIFSTYAL